MRIGSFIIASFLLSSVSGAIPRAPLNPPTGSGNCFYSDDCQGTTKAQSVSANYCRQISGKSWESRRPKTCYNLEPVKDGILFSQ